MTCADVDECEDHYSAVCSQLCVNTVGSYKCDCHTGYIMEADGHNCKIKGKTQTLHSFCEEMCMGFSILHSNVLSFLCSLDISHSFLPQFKHVLYVMLILGFKLSVQAICCLKLGRIWDLASLLLYHANQKISLRSSIYKP